MKKCIRFLSLLLAVLLLLCACNANQGDATTPTTSPYDPLRPLPVLAEKFVSHDAPEGSLVLARDGVATADIVVPAGNTKAAMAAQDLSDYLTKITGAAFQTVDDSQPLDSGNHILVGPTSQTLALGEGIYDPYPNDEGYTIRREGNLLLLCGNDSQGFSGTQFAVTRFLEEAGCGWFAQDELWQVVPETATLSVKAVDKDFAPRFTSRHFARVISQLSTRWYMGGQASLNGHALQSIVPTSSYSQHPEFFALVGDSREPDTGEYWQYCYTNPDFAAAIAAGVIARFNSAPSLMTFSIAANDGWDSYWCECDTCTAAGNHADQMLVFANNVAAITSQVHPDRTVSILAYHSTFLPPLNVEYTHPNVEVMFCLETAPFVDLSKGELVHEGYHSTNRVTYTQSWKDSCQSFIDKANVQNVSIWGWYCLTDGNSDWKDYPWVQGNTASNNLSLWEEMGVQEVFIDCETGLVPLRWPLYYAAARCMWDDAADAETVLYDACIKLYGPIADEMFLYYRHLADAAAQDGGTQNSITWVPPSVFLVYGFSCDVIQTPISAARQKIDLLTPRQKLRFENQENYWNITFAAAYF